MAGREYKIFRSRSIEGTWADIKVFKLAYVWFPELNSIYVHHGLIMSPLYDFLIAKGKKGFENNFMKEKITSIAHSISDINKSKNSSKTSKIITKLYIFFSYSTIPFLIQNSKINKEYCYSIDLLHYL